MESYGRVSSSSPSCEARPEEKYGSHNSPKAHGSPPWIGNRFSFRNLQHSSSDLVKFFGLLGRRFMKRQKDGAAVGPAKLVFFGYGLAERGARPKASQVFSPKNSSKIILTSI
jgi:hypothetical protein